MSTRPDWDTYFLDIARTVATRSSCSRRKVGAVIVRDKRIISTGYNGTPRGVLNCDMGGCPRCATTTDKTSGNELGQCLCSHAEENAITQAAYHGVSVRDGTMYCLLTPCLICAKMIINAGLIEIVYADEYATAVDTQKILADGGVNLRWGLV